MSNVWQYKQELSDGTYISVSAPGQKMAEQACDYLRRVVRAFIPEVSELGEVEVVGPGPQQNYPPNSSLTQGEIDVTKEEVDAPYE
ncbi:uncharacterized protein RMCC_5762 [Mycolicibacterium canariasense]|uniref:Uncharacterized protein n=1 Tax=Mycolicibacterium canariasense TaxID=228230 RepID=A0A100WHN3_MYCCR|nr:hypothetical protein [Mycolicibacterium canariasense]MCV7210150.1 hypothetical protein [Mycolicibacterium canariasense]ORU97856.1 hypothetical protein AWB94_29320 [Mycolicibacterium canariasense]GAS98797.1 uncharacterized protein RMCC_5762 [Mycolicibacterium canariasense]